MLPLIGGYPLPQPIDDTLALQQLILYLKQCRLSDEQIEALPFVRRLREGEGRRDDA